MLRASKKFHDKIKTFSAPLVELLGVSHFYHAIVLNTGHLISINLNHAWEEFFFSEICHLSNWPDICHPHKIEGGVRLLLPDDSTDESTNYQQLLKEAKFKFAVNFSVQISDKFKDGLNIYGFALNSSDLNQHMTLINYMIEYLQNIYI